MTIPSRGVAATRGLGSLAGVLAILIVPPLFLIQAIGWPLPTSVPSSDAIERTLRFGPSDATVINTIAVIAWLAWAQVALALLIEIGAIVRGRPRIALPVLPGTQALAARLAAGLILLSALTQSSSDTASAALPAPVPVANVVELYETPDLRFATEMAPPPALATEKPTDVAEPTVVVQRHDTYWAIAERTLGDGVRWRQIHDLNVGRTMVDGNIIVSTSDLLRPGWVLRLPADADVGSTADLPTPSTQGEVVVEPGDHLWGIAESEMTDRLGRMPTHAEVAPFWRDVIDANQPQLADPDLIHPGQVVTIPGGETVAGPPPQHIPVSPSTTDQPVEPPADPVEEQGAAAPERVATAERPMVSTEEHDFEALGAVDAAEESSEVARGVPGVLAVGGLASAAMAVGLARAVRHRRRRFTRQHAGRIHQGTPDTDKMVHRAALANGDEASIEDLRSVLGRLADDLAEVGGMARPRVLQHSSDHVDVFLAAPDAAPPPGWVAEADGALWTFDSKHPRPASRTCAAPTLVTLGQPDDDGQLYLDLEADGVISLVGDPDSARGVARSILTELTLGPLTDSIQIVVVGDLVDVTASALDHVSLVDTWDEVLENLTEWSEGSHSAVVANGWPNTFVARGHDEFHDALSPLVVIAAKAPPAEVVAMIAAQQPSAVAMVVADEVVGAATVIDCQPDCLTVVDLDLTCTPQDLDDDTFASIMRLLMSTETPADDIDHSANPAATEGEEEGSTVAGSDDETESDGAYVEPDYSILVRVLGDIRIDGVDGLTPKLTAAFTYISLHRSVTVEALEEACWSNLHGTSRQRMRDAMSECRRVVGSQHLPQAQNGHYEVRPSVMTDAELFDMRVARAAQLPVSEAAEVYKSALELVTGKVFTYPSRASKAYSWIDLENLVSQWEVKIAGVAQHCVETYLDLGAPDRAVDVAQAALEALPLHVGLTECLMRSHGAVGNLHAVETVYQAHLEALGRDDEPTEPEESTVQLHGQLLAKVPPRG